MGSGEQVQVGDDVDGSEGDGVGVNEGIPFGDVSGAREEGGLGATEGLVGKSVRVGTLVEGARIVVGLTVASRGEVGFTVGF